VKVDVDTPERPPAPTPALARALLVLLVDVRRRRDEAPADEAA
jgi:hypothetical protein